MGFTNWAAILLLGIGWGSSFFFNELLLRELGPLSVSMGRVALGALGCWVYVLATGSLRGASPRELRQFAVLGAVQYGAPFAFYGLAQQYLTGGATGIVNALTPVMVVVVAQVWPGGERANTAKLLAVLIGFGGIVLLALPALRAGGGSELWAIGIAALAPLCYALALHYTKRLSHVPPAALSAWGLSAATLIMVPLALSLEGLPQITRIETWAALAMLGFVLTSAAFILLYWLLPRVGPLATSTVTYVAPVSALLLGVWFLAEPIVGAQLAGLGAIFVSLMIIDGRLLPRRRQNQPNG